ncbi:uncharacterized protein LOC135167095 [Diachasmimorpha longicaudata]|uniref:uncharacterized protein LOC135167095 n=1 Tax=Diachasmimorpha longicaudata TaxID=58733 RepID=UPI0030B889D5
MNFVTWVCLVLCISQLSLQDVTAAPKKVQLCADLNVKYAIISDNPWLKGLTPNSHNWFDSIGYLKNISSNSSLQISYRVEYNDGTDFFLFKTINWKLKNWGITNFCDLPEGKNTIITTILWEMLGIPEGCPISKGEVKNTSHVHFPFKNECYLVADESGSPEFKIRITISDSEELISPMPLFSAELYSYGPIYTLSENNVKSQA